MNTLVNTARILGALQTLAAACALDDMLADTQARIEGGARDVLAAAVRLARNAHMAEVDGLYEWDCSICDALRDAEIVLRQTGF